MSKQIVEGVPNSRLERLKGHLLGLEEATKKPLLKSPRYDGDKCPIGNFAPKKDSEGYKLFCWREVVIYEKRGKFNRYPLYGTEDMKWWLRLPKEPCCKITRYIQEWIKNR